jgi:hypothetical protein
MYDLILKAKNMYWNKDSLFTSGAGKIGYPYVNV